MQVKTGDRIYLDVRAKAEPAESIVTTDYYTQLPQIRLTGDSTGRPIEPETSTAVTLDGNDIAKLVECAIRHPAPNMRYAVLAAIWKSRRLVSADFPVRS
jgi:hypothetical protein